MLELFPKDEVVGIFRGFRDGGLEFHADLTLPYRPKLHNVPMHGQFLLVQLENPDEAVLGRICSLSADGRLTSGAGEQYSIRAVTEGRHVPDHLREEYLRYRVNIRVLGVVRLEDGEIRFAPSHRRLPHVGSPVAFPSDEVIRWLVGHHSDGAELGFFALGEYIYAGSDSRVAVESWAQVKPFSVAVRFPIKHLVSRRTFVFARAGYGKSNLNKLLFSTLYSSECSVTKRNREAPVGTIIFDPDGEYFWPDDKGNPGLCDVLQLKDRIVLFTSREAPSPFYGSFIAGGIKLDIRRLRPSDVLSIALSPERQDQQNVRKLRGLNPSDWANLVDLIARDGNLADIEEIRELVRLDEKQGDVEAFAARANMTAIVKMLHDPSSQLMDMLIEALSAGKLCIVDVSQLRGGPSLILSGLILRKIFDHNQEEFTKADAKTIPTIAVVEEAQSVLNEKASASGPYIEWVKEGRKYDLGAVLITQQPGSIPTDILSQGDNWFIFHLLSATDLNNVNRANAHFSDDILSSLLNEPIAGQGVFWSGVSGMPFPISLRVLSFSHLYKTLDPTYNRPAVDTYASELREKFQTETSSEVVFGEGFDVEHDRTIIDQGGDDIFRHYQKQAIKALARNEAFRQNIESNGIPWGVVTGMLKEALPHTLMDRDSVAYNLVPDALNEILGPKGSAWTTERRGPKSTLFIVKMQS
jgi:DNA helicase HerA-like ATPase